jgi:glycosyltransferase involved in cell wall biosynthesis
MNSNPLVSIVIPAFNPRFFQRALQGALGQTYVNIEVIVCDDSAGSEIQKVTEVFAKTSSVPLRYVRNPSRLGFIGNLFACLSHAKGEFIKFLCDDDQLFSHSVSMQAEQLMAYADVNLVVGQRLFWDADDIQLPPRLENSALAPTSAVFKGEDLLAIFENFPVNFMGGLSSSLLRRVDAVEILPALTQPDHCFTALLDLALYVCLMRRGNVVVLNNVLSVERLHPDRLSRRQSLRDAVGIERDWLVQILKARSGDASLAKGWVRYQPMNGTVLQERVWVEMPLARGLGTKQSTQQWRVGIDCDNFTDLYAQWLACRTLTDVQQAQLPNTLAHWPVRPKIVPVVIDEAGSRSGLNVTLQSLEAQLYAPELTLVLSRNCQEAQLDGRVFSLPLQDDVHAQLNELLPQLEGAQWVYLLRAGDRLVKPTLLMLAERVAFNDSLQCVYSDEGALRDGESAEPVFKPDFNLDLLRGYPYIGRVLAISRAAIMQSGGFDSAFGALAPHDLVWRLVESGGEGVVSHLSELAVESQLALSEWLALSEVVEQNIHVVRRHLQRCGIEHEIERSDDLPLINRVRYLHGTQPLVSIVVLVKDQVAALQRCVESLIAKTGYRRYELLIVDNHSDNPDTRVWLDAMGQLDSSRIRVLRQSASDGLVNLYNAAVANAQGDYLLMLNPYAVITHHDWLDELLLQAQRPEVGMVGPKIFGPDGQIVHAGLILGLHGPFGVPFAGESVYASGYMQRLQVVHDLSAVGGDCVMVRRALFEEAGGLGQAYTDLDLAYVDLCLRLRERGLLVVWTPQALLAIGSQPAVVQDTARREARERAEQHFLLRWLPQIARDPAYNPNLSLNSLGGISFDLEPGLKSGWTPFSKPQLPNVLALPINASAIGHYRVTEPLIALESAGRAVGVVNYSLPNVLEIERQSPDVIVLQGRYSEERVKEIVSIKTYSQARRIFELDDYVIHVPKKNEHVRGMPDRAEMERVVRLGISLCDRVVVSTQPLADALSAMHHDIRVVPNMLTPQVWGGLRSQRRTGNKPRVGWGGGTSHTGDLEVIAEVVRELAEEVDWVFFGMCPESLRPYIHEFHSVVDLAVYPQKLASLNLDLAVAPLERHIFNDCKSNLRLLEYGACGYPVICTETAAYKGYLPRTQIHTNTTSEWLAAIRDHLSDPDASYRQGDALHEAVMRDFMLRDDNLQHWVTGWLAD